MIKLICNTTLTASYRALRCNEIMLEKDNVYTGDTGDWKKEVQNWKDYCKVNEEVWITEVKQWVPVRYFNDITENREIKLKQLL